VSPAPPAGDTTHNLNSIIFIKLQSKHYKTWGFTKYYLKSRQLGLWHEALRHGALEGRTTMPMMSIETVKKSEHLIPELNGIATAKWNAVTNHSAVYYGSTPTPEEADEQLQWAIEEFRKRKLDAIDVHLRELGIDPTV
jgi:hypothetical protein